MNKRKKNKSEFNKKDLDVFDGAIEYDNSIDEQPCIDVDKIKNELTDYMKEKIDSEVSKTIKNINLSDIDLSSIKDELTNYMKGKIDSEVSSATLRETKKAIKYKNSIIIKRDILIVILLAACFFLGYNLYNISNINIDITREIKNEKTSEKVETKEEKKEDEEVSSNFEDLVKKYEYLVKEISVSEDSEYLNDFYKGNLTDEIRLYVAFNNLDSSLINNDDVIYVDEKALKEEYEDLFDIEYKAKSFNYNDISFKYVPSKGLFLSADNFKKNGTAIKKEIIDIKEDDTLVITTIEGKISKDKLYNILDDKEISNYKNDSLSNYEDALIKLEYTFNKVNDDYKLYKITVK